MTQLNFPLKYYRSGRSFKFALQVWSILPFKDYIYLSLTLWFFFFYFNLFTDFDLYLFSDLKSIFFCNCFQSCTIMCNNKTVKQWYVILKIKHKKRDDKNDMDILIMITNQRKHDFRILIVQ